MRRGTDYRILTNNPLVVRCMEEWYSIDYLEAGSYRDVLVRARDLVYAGHTLFTHPLAGSVKPNETPYRSIVVSREPHAFSAEQAEIVSNSLTAFDKFSEKDWQWSEKVLADFQLIDYTLLAGAMEFDAAAGLDKERNRIPDTNKK
ncbi:MAG: GrdX family protein [Eubacteriales bacterium]|nr:GrdX family protein [Eubacteriales bacterium]